MSETFGLFLNVQILKPTGNNISWIESLKSLKTSGLNWYNFAQERVKYNKQKKRN